MIQRQHHDLRAFDHVLNAHIFIGLVGQIENARTVSNAVLQPTDPVDMFLVIGAGADNIIGFAAKGRLDGPRAGAGDGAGL